MRKKGPSCEFQNTVPERTSPPQKPFTLKGIGKMTTSRVLPLFSSHAPCHDLLIGFLDWCSCSSLHQIRPRPRPRPESIRITEDQAKKMARHSIHHKGLRRSTACQSFCSFAAQTTAAAQSYLSDHISEHQEYMNC